MALHQRARKRIPWHYRSSQKKRSVFVPALVSEASVGGAHCHHLSQAPYKYLVNSHDKTFDKDSMKADKYFSDHLVENVWANSEEEEMVIIRGYCHLSLKSKPTFGNFLTCREGTVV